MTAIERFTESQLNSIREMDRAVTQTNKLRKTQDPQEINEFYEEANRGARAYWDATRQIGPSGEIIIDSEMVLVGNLRLKELGVPQFTNHQFLMDIDKKYNLS